MAPGHGPLLYGVTMPTFRKAPRSYTGAHALVTGGASGLGLELVRQLSAEGARVVVGDLHEEAPAGVLPEGVEYLRLDVRSDDDWATALAWVEQTWGRLDLLVNNAGIAVGGRIDATAIADWQRALDINLMGVVRGCRTFTPMMKAQGSGHIVNTASLAGLVHAPAMAAYNATKAAVVAVSETIKNELGPHGIDVSVICPSFFRTNLASSLAGADVEMEASATKLITEAPRSATQVAALAYAGMRARKHIILTDSDGRGAYHAKRFARPIYDAGMAVAAARVASGRPPQPAFLEKMNARAARRSR